MPLPKLLLIGARTSAPVESEYRDVLPGFCITSAAGMPEASRVIAADEMDCVLIMGQGPEVPAADILETIHRHQPTLPIVIWDPDMGAADAVRLIRAGAYHCVGYRDGADALRECMENAAEEHRSRQRRRRAASASEAWKALLIGESSAMATVYETIRLVGPRRCNVLITGETGTGKEMAARALHLASPRANQPLVAINCSALPEHLLEAELFGHVKGAFTGAIQNRMGRFEQANKGTLFLDEVGDMPLELQTKLLRVLQERVVQRLGSSDDLPIDVRVVAASNVNLQDRVHQGRFRADLYYRLNVVPLQMPPLRQRESDIPLLADHFMNKICKMEGVPLKYVVPEAMDRLRSGAWPGNVRQLENAVEMAVALSGEREALYASDFGLSSPLPAKIVSIEAGGQFNLPESMDFGTAVGQFERAMLESALLRTSGNKTAAAELLGMKRTTLIMKLRSFESLSRACAG
jgi:DNA-binding NtrC family response regulator